jgi:hypothetical protein
MADVASKDGHVSMFDLARLTEEDNGPQPSSAQSDHVTPSLQFKAHNGSSQGCV